MCSKFNWLKNECDPVTGLTINSNNITIIPDGGFNVTGDCKWALYTLRGISTVATATNLFRDLISEQTLDVPAGWSWTFKISIIGSQTPVGGASPDNTTNMSYIAEGAIGVSSAGTSSLGISKESTVIGSGLSGPTVSFTAPGGVFTFKCNANGGAGTEYHWFGSVEATEVKFI